GPGSSDSFRTAASTATLVDSAQVSLSHGRQPPRRHTTEGAHTTATTTSSTETRGRVRVEHGAKRVRAYVAGELVADTTRPLLVWEKPYYPTYYFPAADVRADLLSEDGGVAHSPSRGDAKILTINAGGQERAGAALLYEQSPFDELQETLRLD